MVSRCVVDSRPVLDGLFFIISCEGTDRRVPEGIPRVVDPDPPCGERAACWMGDDASRVGRPLLNLLNQRDCEIVVEWKPVDVYIYGEYSKMKTLSRGTYSAASISAPANAKFQSWCFGH